MTVNEKSIFDIITECSINERMDNTLLQDEEYIKIQEKISEHTRAVDKLNLTKEQSLIVDRLVSVYTEGSALYGKMAYRQGFQDCASLLLEMKLLRAS